MIKNILAFVAIICGSIAPMGAVMYALIYLWVGPTPLGLLAGLVGGGLMLILPRYLKNWVFQLVWLVVALSVSYYVWPWLSLIVLLGLALDHFGYDMYWWRIV